MNFARLWPYYLIGLLLLAAYFLAPMPLTGQTTAVLQLESAPTTSSVAPGHSQNLASAPTRAMITTSTASLHAQPGHLCDRCPETDELPPWRRRIAERIATGRPASLGVEQQP